MPTTYYGNPFTPYPTGPGTNPQLDTDIQSLLTPGLVPDIARQSAEVTAGRGIAGSPAAGTTAVKMSEQNFQQRLALANQLMSGRTQRNLPYQITPWQQMLVELEKMRHRTAPTGGGEGGGGRAPVNTPWAGYMAGQQPVIESVYGTRQPGTTSSPFTPAAGGYGGGTSLWGGVNVGGPLGGPGGLTSGNDLTLDDMYEQYGFNAPVASDGGTGGGDLSNWDWNYQPPDSGGGGDYFGD